LERRGERQVSRQIRPSRLIVKRLALPLTSIAGTLPFVTTWNIATNGETLEISTRGTVGNYTVDWGDGSAPENFTTPSPTHTYATAGVYTVSISGPELPDIALNNSPSAEKILSVEECGYQFIRYVRWRYFI